MFDTVVRVGEVTARVRDAAADLAAVSRASAAWSAAERAEALAAVRAGEAALAEARAHLLVADRQAGDTVRPGDRSFEAAHARVSRAGIGEATRQVRQADALVSMPVVAAGVREGSVPLPHLDALARVAATASPQVASVLRTPGAQQSVLAMARTRSAPDFARALARFVATQDPAGVQGEHDRQYRERFLSLSAQPDGVFLKGRLDRVAGESLRVALDAMGQFGDQTRSPGQASADALTMLAEKVCAGTGPGAGERSATAPAGAGAGAGAGAAAGAGVGARAGVGAGEAAGTGVGGRGGAAGAAVSGMVPRPHVSLLVSAETVAELIAHERAGADVVAPPITLPGGTVAPATLEDGTPVAMSELARVLCQADLTRIVMSAEGVPLDVGRTKRLFSTAQRRAVVARDGQCVWNGCEQHASRCEVHHVRWWGRDAGPTSVANAALLCRFHHSEVHRLHLSIHRQEKPPGWTRRQRTKAAAAAAAAARGDGGDVGGGGQQSTPDAHGGGERVEPAARGGGERGEPAARGGGQRVEPAARGAGQRGEPNERGRGERGGPDGRGGGVLAEPVAREPMRYVFRNTRGLTVNGPEGHRPDA
ncbi:HNH endonuclease signature motif containing protein [Cellulomonas fengjieae]|uniref:HNH endonuclease signature motif containing protein n=1 Tax=Cellulomonas fengjieae TaxID=2819978 RepID=UPI001AAF5841|nr:HNH endonuclease signature motif containing protein [Cellulomonas fengjieae]MBO3101484.1 DUF222 domain-containing protein [Cellulomonas fengjieae]